MSNFRTLWLAAILLGKQQLACLWDTLIMAIAVIKESQAIYSESCL
ncbi:hypothetical protein [aff. Roholtiella sp. LEGE 12411]|nr:hypothetical protein [aff. Roholtiella sp. LEGE 12411]